MSRLDQLLAFQEEDPQDSFIRFALASEYVKLGDFERGRTIFEELRSHDPGYVGLYYHLGKLLEKIGDSSQAIVIYREGIAIAARISDFHARSELQSALLEAEIEGYE